MRWTCSTRGKKKSRKKVRASPPRLTKRISVSKGINNQDPIYINNQDPDAPQLDAAAAAEAVVKARVELIELTAAPQPTNFPLVLNVLTMIAISEYKVLHRPYPLTPQTSTPDLRPNQGPKHARPF